MNERECNEFIGHYIIKSSQCEEKISQLIATRDYTIEMINALGITFYNKIEVLKRMLPNINHPHTEAGYDLISELHKIRETRNDMAHGLIYIGDKSFSIMKVSEEKEVNYSFGEIPMYNFALNKAFNTLATLWEHTNHHPKAPHSDHF